MKPKTVTKIIVDAMMTIVLLIQMAYHLIGELRHEWFGASIFILFVAHHIMNWSFIRNLFKGKFSALRIFQICINLFTFLTMICIMVSGVMMSRHVFAFLPIYGGQSFARTLHHVSVYWGFILMSLHIGLHWKMIIGMVGKVTKTTSKPHKRKTFPIIGIIIAAYGAYAFVMRQVPHYMFFQIQYSFFDYAEPAILFFIDYIAIIGLFVFFAYYVAKLIQKCSGRSVMRKGNP